MQVFIVEDWTQLSVVLFFSIATTVYEGVESYIEDTRFR